jgi:hypothetical protein
MKRTTRDEMRRWYRLRQITWYVEYTAPEIDGYCLVAHDAKSGLDHKFPMYGIEVDQYGWRFITFGVETLLRRIW